MYVGWMILGEGHPLDPTSNKGDELINNDRALAYAAAMGVGWLHNCEDCDQASDVGLAGAIYGTPKTDPAPWYDARFPDTAGFCGIFGVDVSGAEDSTTTATVTPALATGGVIGKNYSQPREMVVRGLAVADSECALQEGFNWFRQRAHERAAGCIGDTLSFFYCCPPLECRPDAGIDPCPCDDMTTPGGPCWVDTYGELKTGCGADWWPTTYGELKAGPPAGTDWCHWVYVYYELRIGADAWSCGAEACMVPYLWQFYECAVTDGPNVVNHRKLTTGSFIEFDMTVTAGDPTPHRLKGHPL